MIKCSGTPAAGAVTGSALCAKRTGVRIIFKMTGRAIHGRAFEQIILMTICTSSGCMLAVELEGEFRMIHFRRLPTFR